MKFIKFEGRAVFFDISEAFDKVWHEGLFFQLEQNGISAFQNYINNRKQHVILNRSFSRVVFLVLYYSLSTSMIFKKNMKLNINFFADDTMLFCIVKNPDISADDLNHDLDVINKWAPQWKLILIHRRRQLK